jgi:hypothetical protein
LALYAFSTSLDLTGAGKGRRLASWALSQGTGAGLVNLRSGSASGPILVQVQVPTASSRFQAFEQLPVFPNGLYIEVTTSGLAAGSVDLV